MTQTNSNLIEQFLADTLNHEQKKEFVKRLTSDKSLIRELLQELDLDSAIDTLLEPKE